MLQGGDRQQEDSDRNAANRVASLTAVLDVLNEIDTRGMKTRMEGLEKIAGVITLYLAESAAPGVNVAE